MNIMHYIEELENGYSVEVTRRTANAIFDYMCDNDFDTYEYNMADTEDNTVEIWRV